MRLVSAWFIVMLVAQCSSAQESLRLDLKGAVQYALAQSPVINTGRLQTEVSVLGVKNARMSLFPKIQTSASTGLSGQIPAWSSSWTNSLSLSLDQPLLSNSFNGITINIAEVKETIARLELLHQRDLLCMKVAKDFFAYAASQEQQLIASEKYAALFKQLEVVTARFNQGIKRERDVLRFKAQVQQAQIQVATAKNRVLQTRNTLIAAITGRNRQEQNVIFEFETSYPRVDISSIPTVEPLIAHHVIYKKLELERELANLDVKFSKRQLWPELSGSLGASFGDVLGLQRPFENLPTGTFMLGLTLRYELFDFGKRHRDVLVSSKNRAIKEDGIQIKLSTETLAIAEMMASFSLIRESFMLNKSLLKLEEDNFRKIETDYLQGKAQYLDVISALNSLSDVKGAFLTTLFDLETQLITYRYYEGTLHDWLS